MRYLFRYPQVDTRPRRSPSACPEMSKTNTETCELVNARAWRPEAAATDGVHDLVSRLSAIFFSDISEHADSEYFFSEISEHADSERRERLST